MFNDNVEERYALAIERIKEIENNFVNLKPKVIIQASYSRFNIEELKKIIEVCRENNIEIAVSAFKRSAEEMKEIIEVCRKNDIEITESVFLKSAEKLKKMWNI